MQGVVQVGDRLFGRLVGEFATSAAELLAVAAGGLPVHIVRVRAVNRSGSSRDVSLAHVPSGSTYSDDEQDYLNETTIADKEPYIEESPHPDVPLMVLTAGDKLHGFASGADVNYEIVYWTASQNRGAW